LTISENKLY